MVSALVRGIDRSERGVVIAYNSKKQESTHGR